ncbi:MAG: hypothetical protein MK008_14685 [Bdellovibrionales bacterium]|nr:hypothetical protein [Bdellovibrionales bacterium]
MKDKYLVTTFYKFFPIDKQSLSIYQSSILAKGEELGIYGLLLLGTEGVNSTLSGEPKKLEEMKNFLKTTLEQPDLFFKDSWAPKNPFKRYKVKVRKEIVTLGTPELVPEKEQNNHLPPNEWHEMLQREDVVVIDTRNHYETEIGKFKQAMDPNIKDFKEFPEYLEKAQIDKDKNIMIYCTGGIRCEKAILDMHRKGYKNVYQLEGGILNYMQHYPQGDFEGECFVFDHRVSVDGHLNPSKTYSLCPHCGNPGKEVINCKQCDKEAKVCHHCLEKDAEIHSTCSKNCAYHYQRQHQKTC